MTKEMIGIVVSDKMDKTITVAVKKQTSHIKYGKILSSTKKYKAHDELNQCHFGDIVKIKSTRPLSKTKHWILVNLISKESNN